MMLSPVTADRCYNLGSVKCRQADCHVKSRTKEAKHSAILPNSEGSSSFQYFFNLQKGGIGVKNAHCFPVSSE